MRPLLTFTLAFMACAGAFGATASKPAYTVGVARVDITPDYPVRLTGYAARSGECTNVAQHIFAKALAFGKDREQPKIVITVDNCGVPINVRNDVVETLRRKAKVDPENVTICSTHTHSAPWLEGYLTNLFLGPLPPDQTLRIKRYTSELTGWMVEAALKALKDRKPASLDFKIGNATFAANRRKQGGPEDHDVPILTVRGADGRVRAVWASYACHCTTLTAEFNSICGDWAGFAAAQVEQESPGTVCLISLGCAGDANPKPRPGYDLARAHGAQIALAIAAAVKEPGTKLAGALACRTNEIRLPYDTLPTRAEWEAKTKESPYVAQHARINLARLDRGEQLPTALPYMIQTWSFGDSLAMVFLPGEVTSEYGLRLKREYDRSRLWVNAYANDVPCYVPSERVLNEGGYEGGFAMVYYDRPTRFAPGVEDRIIQAVRKVMPAGYERAAEPKQ